MLQSHEERHVRERSEQAACEHDLLPPDRVRQLAEDDEERRPEGQSDRHEDVRRQPVDLERRLQKRQRVKLPRVPDDALAGGSAEECDEHVTEVDGISEALLERVLRRLSARLHLGEERRFAHLHPDVDRYGEQDERQEKRNPPAVRLERSLAERAPRRADDAHAEEEAERRRRLDEARVVAALTVGDVLGHVRRRSSVFAAERQALEQAKTDEEDGRGEAPALVRRQQPDERRRQSHRRHRDQKRVFAADEIAHVTEDDRAERPDAEARTERGEAREELRRVVLRGEKSPPKKTARLPYR